MKRGGIYPFLGDLFESIDSRKGAFEGALRGKREKSIECLSMYTTNQFNSIQFNQYELRPTAAQKKSIKTQQKERDLLKRNILKSNQFPSSCVCEGGEMGKERKEFLQREMGKSKKKERNNDA